MSDTTTTVMDRVHDMLAAEFGRCATPVSDDGVQLVHLPGGRFAIVVRMSSDHTVTVSKLVGEPNWELPGLADFLLRDHSRWLFGRFERNGDLLNVEHTLETAGLTSQALAAVIIGVQLATCEAEKTLLAVGALEGAKTDEEETD